MSYFGENFELNYFGKICEYVKQDGKLEMPMDGCSWACALRESQEAPHKYGRTPQGQCPFMDFISAVKEMDAEKVHEILSVRYGKDPEMRAKLLQGDDVMRGAQYGFLLVNIMSAHPRIPMHAKVEEIRAYLAEILRHGVVDLRITDVYQRSGLLRIAQFEHKFIVFGKSLSDVLRDDHGYSESEILVAKRQHAVQHTMPVRMIGMLQDAEDKGLHLVVACLFPHAQNSIHGPSKKLEPLLRLEANAAFFRESRFEGGETLLHLAVRACAYACYGRGKDTGYWRDDEKELQNVLHLFVHRVGLDPLATNAKGQGLMEIMLSVGATRSAKYEMVEALTKANYERNVGVAMALHPRLGKNSVLAALGVDLIRSHVAPHMCAWPAL